MNLFGKNTEPPTVIDTEVAQRSRLTFSVEGFAAREELLVKGYIRLLDYLTEHQWQYHEPSRLRRVDLLISSSNVQPTRFSQAGSTPQPLLQLGADNISDNPFFLVWPLKPNELERQLNRLGRLICSGGVIQEADGSAKSGTESGAEPSTEPVPLAADSGDPQRVEAPAAPAASMLYSLRQWPKPMLLTEPGRMRLATLITGRAMSFEEMVFRSALSATVCERFLADMRAAGLLSQPTQPAQAAANPPSTPPPAKKPRLEPQQERQFMLADTAPVLQPGLLSRIRMRLGIKSRPTH